MATQSLNGAGFEFACANALLKQYSHSGRCLQLESSSVHGYEMREQKFDQVDPDFRLMMKRSAHGLANHLTTSKERWAKKTFDSSDRYLLHIGDDSRNMDVRDLVIYSERGAELGISLKWNSEEIKSLRLGDNWFQQFHINDHTRWHTAVDAHHRRLQQFETWKQATEALGREGVYSVYKDAIIDQLRQGMYDRSTVHALSEFLFGRQSYLKAMAVAKGSELCLAYYDTDNLPTRILDISPHEKGEQYLQIAFDRGWTLLLRLHNKDTKIKQNVGSGMSVTVTVLGWGEKSGKCCWKV